MDEYITRAEHKEFGERLDAENNRQNRRIEILESTTKQISELPYRNLRCQLKIW